MDRTCCCRRQITAMSHEQESGVGPKAKCQHVRYSVGIGAKADLVSGTEREEQMRSSVTQRDDGKLETLTASNPRPLLVEMIRNISTHQCGSANRRLVHNIHRPILLPSFLMCTSPWVPNNPLNRIASAQSSASGRLKRVSPLRAHNL